MRILPIQQASLWESVCHQCLAVDQCGGAETAPCRCVRSGDQYKQCDTCPLVCRDRRLHDEHGEVIDSFALRLREGLPLQLLRLTHVRDLRLPPLMLSRTESLPEGLSVPDGWVAVHLRTLVPRLRMDAGPTNSETAFRHRLRVRPTAKLVAVMNGNDDLLERLWSLPRRALFTRLRAIGIRILTGPSLLRVRRERTTSGQQQRCHASSPPPVLCGRSGCGTDRASKPLLAICERPCGVGYVAAPKSDDRDCITRLQPDETASRFRARVERSHRDPTAG